MPIDHAYDYDSYGIKLGIFIATINAERFLDLHVSTRSDMILIGSKENVTSKTVDEPFTNKQL